MYLSAIFVFVLPGLAAASPAKRDYDTVISDLNAVSAQFAQLDRTIRQLDQLGMPNVAVSQNVFSKKTDVLPIQFHVDFVLMQGIHRQSELTGIYIRQTVQDATVSAPYGFPCLRFPIRPESPLHRMNPVLQTIK
jgi:hypothetical protein